MPPPTCSQGKSRGRWHSQRTGSAPAGRAQPVWHCRHGPARSGPTPRRRWGSWARAAAPQPGRRQSPLRRKRRRETRWRRWRGGRCRRPAAAAAAVLLLWLRRGLQANKDVLASKEATAAAARGGLQALRPDKLILLKVLNHRRAGSPGPDAAVGAAATAAGAGPPSCTTSGRDAPGPLPLPGPAPPPPPPLWVCS